MHTRSLQITRLIHENCAVLMMFAFSRPSLERLRNDTFVGDWKYFDKMCFETTEIKANRAALELAVHLRVLDDEQKFRRFLELQPERGFGTRVLNSGVVHQLSFRDVTNKILHSSAFQWNFDDPSHPKLVCLPTDEDQWVRAEIELVSLAAFCGELIG